MVNTQTYQHNVLAWYRNIAVYWSRRFKTPNDGFIREANCI